MNIRVFLIALLAILFLALPAPDTLAQQPAVSIQILTTFDYPGAGNSTTAQGISNRGDIAGHFSDSLNVNRSFVRLRNGNFSPPIVEPNDTGNTTLAIGINTSRTLCGYFFSTTDNAYHGFFLSGNTYTQFDFGGPVSTFVLGLNDAGDFVGSFGSDTQPVQGFVLPEVGDEVIVNVSGATRTDVNAINAAQEIVGDYIDGSLNFHSFLRKPDGTLLFPLDFPGSTATILLGLNDRGLVVGRYIDAGGGVHGLVLRRPGTFVSFDYPGATETSLNGINNSNVISGRYTDEAGVRHGFLARVR
jgi:hypothetical protein